MASTKDAKVIIFRPADAAKEIGVTVNTIRNWCRDYGGSLSTGARGESGNRQLTGRDVEILKYIAQLRKEKLQEPQIKLRLQEKSFGDIDRAESVPANESTSLQESPLTALVPFGALVETLRSVEARLTALEQAQQTTESRFQPIEAQRLRVDAVWLGVACFIAGLIVGLAVWWFQ